MVSGLKDNRGQGAAARYASRRSENLPSPGALKQKIKDSRTPGCGRLTEEINHSYSLPVSPPDFTVLAADGSTSSRPAPQPAVSDQHR
jgi:hypothetical protein